MFSFETVRPFYPFAPSPYLVSLAASNPDFEREATLPFLSEEEFAAVEQATKVDSTCFAFLRKMNASLLADPARNLAARFLRYAMFAACNPWENQIYAPVLFEIPGYETGSVDLLFVTAALGYTLTVRKPPAEHNAENLDAYRGYIKQYTDAHDHWGINERSWNILCAGGCMFPFHTLKFQPDQFSWDFLAITDGVSFRTLLRGSFSVCADGSLTQDPARTSFQSSFTETEEAYIAHEVLPNGCVQPQTQVFPKSIWSVALQGGDMMLGFHIPSNSEYTPEQHRISMQMALDFYRTFYPNTEFKGFVCYSWLYSAQNRFLLPPDSRILEMQRCVHLCPISTVLDESLMFIRKGSALQEKLAAFRAAGNEYHTGYMYTPLAEAEVFGTYRHTL